VPSTSPMAITSDAHGATALYREAADRANVNAMINLARLREQAGDMDSAERIRRFGLNADGSPAEPWTLDELPTAFGREAEVQESSAGSEGWQRRGDDSPMLPPGSYRAHQR
jgi:hypothetical protein